MSGYRKNLLKQLFKNRSVSILYRFVVVLLVLILASAFVLSIANSKILEEDFGKSPENKDNSIDYECNIFVLMNSTSENFLSEFKEGIFRYGEENRILIDFVNAEDVDQAVNSINIAAAAKVDGIIAQGIYNVEYIAAINKAIDRGIPVEFVYTDARGTNRNYFVGFNAYDLGKKAAGATMEALQQERGEIALLVQSFSKDEKDITSSLIIEGYKAITDKYANIEIVEIARTSHDLLSAEDITYEILNKHPEIDAIVCTGEKDTFGAAQVLIDLNRVGNVHLVGIGVSEEILRYIELRVIDASFDMRPDEMSKKSIETMAGRSHANDFIEIPFDIVTVKNAARYKE